MLQRIAVLALALLLIPLTAARSEVRRFWIENNSPRLILLIHGIGGSLDAAFAHDRNVNLVGLLRMDRSFAFSDIAGLGYDSRKIGHGGKGIEEIAKDLLEELSDTPEIAIRDYKSIVVIAHSMGGLVFRELLLADTPPTAIEGEPRPAPVDSLGLAAKMNSAIGHGGGLIFMGVPMDGSYLASLLHAARGATTATENLSRNAVFDAENYVDGLRDRWHNGPQILHGIRTQCAYETVPQGLMALPAIVLRYVGAGDEGLIVPPQSAEPFCGPFQALAYTHEELVKPASLTDNRFDFIRESYLNLNPDLNDLLLTKTPEKDGHRQVLPQGEGPDLVQVYCAFDRYEQDGRALSGYLAERVFAARPDFTRIRSARQFFDWPAEGADDAGYVFSIWGAYPTPEIVSVHWSCFESVAATSTHEAMLANTEDFLAFAASMKRRGVKLLIYSSAEPKDILGWLETANLSGSAPEPDFCLIQMKNKGWDTPKDLPARFDMAIDALMGKGACPDPVHHEWPRPRPRS